MKVVIFFILIISSIFTSHQTEQLDNALNSNKCQDPTDSDLEMQLIDINAAYFWFLAERNNMTVEKNTRPKRSFRINRKKNSFSDEIFTKTLNADQYPKQGEILTCSPNSFMKKFNLIKWYTCEPVYEDEIFLLKDVCQANGLYSYTPFLRRVPLLCQIAIKN